jgi:hypothetical protein
VHDLEVEVRKPGGGGRDVLDAHHRARADPDRLRLVEGHRSYPQLLGLLEEGVGVLGVVVE